MKLLFDKQLAEGYTSRSQKVRVLTEAWVDNAIFCPNCGRLNIDKYPAGRPVADFHCSNCREEYELKSKQNVIGAKIVDGAYHTMLERITSSNNPNFFLLNYDLSDLEVTNFLVIPKHFFTPEIIIRRKQGLPNRPDYIMCSINLSLIPQSGKIFYVRDRQGKRKCSSNGRRHFFCGRKRKFLQRVGYLM